MYEAQRVYCRCVRYHCGMANHLSGKGRLFFLASTYPIHTYTHTHYRACDRPFGPSTLSAVLAPRIRNAILNAYIHTYTHAYILERRLEDTF